jgi:hypothetical protein
MEVSDVEKERILDEQIRAAMTLLAVLYPPGCENVIELPGVKKSKIKLTLRSIVVKICKLIDKRMIKEMAKVTYVCKSCGKSIKPISITPGSFFIELILWLAMILPGLLYSVWRVSSRYKGCPVCKSRDVIPSDSPLAKNFTEEKNNTDITVQIENLSNLKDKGIITEDEFSLKKAELLAKL